MSTPTTFYQKKNNAKTTITNNPLTAGGLSITLASSTGSKFPTTGATWLGTIWDAVTYSDPSDDPNMEIVLIDSRSTDTLTVNASGRGFAGTTAVSHATGSAFRLLILKEHVDQYETAIQTLEGWADPTGASSGTQTIGYAQITSNNTTGSASNSDTVVDIGSLTTTVTVPAGGRYVEVKGFARLYNQSAAATLTLYLYEGVTLLGKSSITSSAANTVVSPTVFKIAVASAGAHTYKLAASTSGLSGGINVEAGATFPAFIHAVLV